MHLLSRRLKRRSLYRRIAHQWAILRRRERIVLGGVFAGFICGFIVSATCPAAFASTAVINVGIALCDHGMPVSQACPRCEDRKVPFHIRYLRQIDSTSKQIGFGDPELEHMFTRLAKTLDNQSSLK